MTAIAVLNNSQALKNVDCCFLVQACAEQMIEFCQTWGLDPWAVAFYSTEIGLPTKDVYIFRYVDRLDVDGALAYHTLDPLGRPCGFMLPPDDPLDATDLSHEILETRGDPDCDRWVKMPNGNEEAVEVCDPVQGAGYSVPVEVLGETRSVKLSDYVLWAYFDELGRAPFDRLGRLPAPFTVDDGGYCVQIDAAGNEHNVFGRVPAHKLLDPGARLARRLRPRRAA